MRKQSIEEIKKANAKEKELNNNAWYSRNVARHISLFITKPFVWMHPNTVCFIMILVGLLSIPFFIKGDYWSLIIGSLILQLHYVLDHVDGNVARLTNKKTWRGKYLDFIGNITVNPLVLMAIGIGIFNISKDITYLYLGFSAAFFFVTVEPARLFKYLMFDELKIKNSLSGKDSGGSVQKINKYFIEVIFNFPGMMNLILIFSVFNILNYLIIFYGLTFPLLFVLRASYEFYSWKKRDSRKL